MQLLALPASVLRIGTLAVLLAGCVAQGPVAPTPGLLTAGSSPTPAPSASATSSLPPSALPTTAPPTPSWTMTSGSFPPGFLYQVAQMDPVVDGHGGSPPLDLPASVAIDYTVSGSCTFEIGIYSTTATTPIAVSRLSVAGQTISGTWQVRIKPGQYYVGPADAPGCVFLVTVRAA